MSSIQTQFPTFTLHTSPYPAIDPQTTLKGSAAGKVVFLAGASQGIGQATAIAFAQAGAAAIYLTARSLQALEETRALVLNANPATRCAFSRCDVTENAQVQAAVEDCVTQFGGIDVADCNAGYLDNWSKIGESDPASWWRSWEVNVRGTYHVVRHTIAHLVASARKFGEQGSTGGHLILTSSNGAQLLADGASDYGTAKHAINRLCEFIHKDHGEEGVKCFAIHPGGVATNLARNMPESMYHVLVDEAELPASFIVWLSTGQADWASGRFISVKWDVEEFLARKDEILRDDLMVNRLRIIA